MGAPQIYDPKPAAGTETQADEGGVRIEPSELDAIAADGLSRIQDKATEDMAELDAGIEIPAE